jgi:uncharacterized membrane protein
LIDAGSSWGFSKFIQSTLSLPQGMYNITTHYTVMILGFKGVLIALILGIAVLIAVIIFAFGVLSLRK